MGGAWEKVGAPLQSPRLRQSQIHNGEWDTGGWGDAGVVANQDPRQPVVSAPRQQESLHLGEWHPVLGEHSGRPQRHNIQTQPYGLDPGWAQALDSAAVCSEEGAVSVARQDRGLSRAWPRGQRKAWA